MNPRLIGILVMAGGMLLLPVGDAIAKYITQITLYSGAFLAWTRFIIGAALVGPYAIATGAFAGLGWGFLGRQALRGGLLGFAITCMINAVDRAPIAEVYGAFFVGPSVATVLAIVFLRERVKLTDWAIVLIGFVGVLLVIQPTASPNPGLFWALGGGCFFGSFVVATRWSAGTAPPVAQLAGQFVFGGLILAPLGVWDLIEHGIDAPVLILAAAITSGASNLMQIIAFRFAGAVYLAPVIYSQIVSATLISVLVFGDSLGSIAMIGLILIVSCALFKVPWARLLRG
ncbi:MAG: DMT family transporter [Pseudomonadota bacterium]